MKEKDASKLEDEYRRLVEGLQAGEGSGLDGDGRPEDEDFMANPGALLCFHLSRSASKMRM
jgi:DNA excision repair protein ERCC-2